MRRPMDHHLCRFARTGPNCSLDSAEVHQRKRQRTWTGVQRSKPRVLRTSSVGAVSPSIEVNGVGPTVPMASG